MKKKLLVGLSVSIFLVTGCTNKQPQATSVVKYENNNSIKKEKKKILIDLDKEIKDDGLKGGAFETIRGLIPMGNSDEVSFIGQKLFIATPIKLYINGKLKATIKSIKGMFTIKGSEVNNGDTVTFKNRFGVKLVEKKVVKK
jgi:hypothetical protein